MRPPLRAYFPSPLPCSPRIACPTSYPATRRSPSWPPASPLPLPPYLGARSASSAASCALFVVRPLRPLSLRSFASRAHASRNAHRTLTRPTRPPGRAASDSPACPSLARTKVCARGGVATTREASDPERTRLEAPQPTDNVDRLKRRLLLSFPLLVLLLCTGAFSLRLRLREERVADGLALRDGRERRGAVGDLARELRLEELRRCRSSVSVAAWGSRREAREQRGAPSRTSGRGSPPWRSSACSWPR